MDKLKNLLKLNKHIKIELVKEKKIVNLLYKGNIIKSIPFYHEKIEDNPDVIYYCITSLKNINLYIPKVYTREK